MKEIKKIVGLNLLLLIVYTLLIHVNATDSQRELEVMILMMLAVGCQTFINLLVGLFFFIRGNSEMGKSFLVGMAVVLVIGFSACLGSIAI